MADNFEDLMNVSKTNMKQFYDDLEGKLALLTGLIDYSQFGLTLEDIRKPICVIGDPGIGKTCGIISIIKRLNTKLDGEHQLGFKKIQLGQTVVGTLQGVPVVGKDGTVVRVQVPDLPDEARDGKYGVLFLDEITTADEMQIQPALGLADESRTIGEYTLPEHWIVVAAGNGPNCSNFIRLDDMTITRFALYNIMYNFKKDWRPYAHEHGINSDIIAFLNFDNTMCVRVESSEMDKSGKMFPCPRTWERLSTELRMREALGKAVSSTEMTNFGARIVGYKAANEFTAFLAFKKDLSYDPVKIFEGTEREPEAMPKQTFHILLQKCIRDIKQKFDETVDANGDHPYETYKALANMINWFLAMSELENKVNVVIELRDDLPVFMEVFADKDFNAMCPALNEFFTNYASFIINYATEL